VQRQDRRTGPAGQTSRPYPARLEEPLLHNLSVRPYPSPNRGISLSRP
jgi:hypothetical protein